MMSHIMTVILYENIFSFSIETKRNVYMLDLFFNSNGLNERLPKISSLKEVLKSALNIPSGRWYSFFFFNFEKYCSHMTFF